MKTSNAVIWLSSLIVVLALVAVAGGLFWPGEGGPYAFTALRGQTMQVYGQGLYRYDSVFKGSASRGTDVVTLCLGIPLLAFSTVLYRRGSPRGGLLLTGTLAYFLYIYASLVLGAAYNPLFLVYIALFSASLFTFVLSFRSVQPLSARFSNHLPLRGIAIFMFVSGLLTLVVWLGPLAGSMIQGRPPALLESYTTMVTDALDLGIIVPLTFLTGILLLRRDPHGYLIAFPLLVVLVILGPVVAAQTVSQIAAGISYTTGEVVGPIAGFITLGLVAIWILAALLRDIGNSTTTRAPLVELSTSNRERTDAGAVRSTFPAQRKRSHSKV